MLKRLVKKSFEKATVTLQSKPLLAGCTISSVLLGLGDLLTQTLVENKKLTVETRELTRSLMLHTIPSTISHSTPHSFRTLEFGTERRDRDLTLGKIIVENNVETVDFLRVGKSMAIGFCVMAPNLFCWYRKGLPRLLNSKFLSKFTPFKRNLVVMGIDQTLFFTYWTGLFIFANEFLGEQCHLKAAEKVREDLGEKVKQNWMYWPAIVLFNLTFIHPLFRTAFINFCGVWYNVGSAAVKAKV